MSICSPVSPGRGAVRQFVRGHEAGRAGADRGGLLPRHVPRQLARLHHAVVEVMRWWKVNRTWKSCQAVEIPITLLYKLS